MINKISKGKAEVGLEFPFIYNLLTYCCTHTGSARTQKILNVIQSVINEGQLSFQYFSSRSERISGGFASLFIQYFPS